MTALRPERESEAAYGEQSYAEQGGFEQWHGAQAQGAPGVPYGPIDEETVALRIADLSPERTRPRPVHIGV